MRKLAGVLVALLAVGWTAGAQTPRGDARPQADELARRVQARYNGVTDFTADFVGTFRYELTRQTSVERGTLKIKKPNRMRWTYTQPSRKEFVADGSQFYAYIAEDKLVDITPLPQAGDAPLALLFLAGRGDLTRDFTAALPADQPDGEWRLVLTPRTRQEDYTRLTLEVRRDTLDLTGLVMEDDLGIQTFEFARFRPNRGLRNSEFVFEIPKGVEIRR
jgi:outer membrane lipoprotein carrier protein